LAAFSLLVTELFERDDAGLWIGAKIHLLAVLDAFAFSLPVIGFDFGGQTRFWSCLPWLASRNGTSFYKSFSRPVALRIGSLTDGSLFYDNHAVCGAATASQINRSGEKT